MKILNVTAQKPDSTGSGVYLAEMVKAFEAAGHKTAVIAGIAPDDDPALPHGTLFRPVLFETETLWFPVVGMSDEMPYRSTRYRDLDESMVAAFEAAFAEALDEVVSAFDPDVIVCHHLYLLTALVRRLYPDRMVAAVCHSTDIRQMTQHGLAREAIREAVCALDCVLALHEAQKAEIVEVYGIDPSRVHVLGTGFNDRVFCPDGACERRDRGEGDRTELVFVGKIWEKKGVVSLLRALDLLKVPEGALRLRLAGGHASDEEYAAICRLGSASRYPVEFLGKLDQASLADVYRSSDVFVLPSFFEGLPLVLVEALACGCAAVVTDLPGIRPWVEAEMPEAPVVFVRPPAMRNADEPTPEELPAFEQQLADAIECAMKLPRAGGLEVSHLSWAGLCERALSFCCPIQDLPGRTGCDDLLR